MNIKILFNNFIKSLDFFKEPEIISYPHISVTEALRKDMLNIGNDMRKVIDNEYKNNQKEIKTIKDYIIRS